MFDLRLRFLDLDEGLDFHQGLDFMRLPWKGLYFDYFFEIDGSSAVVLICKYGRAPGTVPEPLFEVMGFCGRIDPWLLSGRLRALQRRRVSLGLHHRMCYAKGQVVTCGMASC